eukprot:scaffold1895_cov123-Isochrysis_galbana.AAC.14
MVRTARGGLARCIHSQLQVHTVTNPSKNLCLCQVRSILQGKQFGTCAVLALATSPSPCRHFRSCVACELDW